MHRKDFIRMGAMAGLTPVMFPQLITKTAHPVPNGRRYQDGESPWPLCLDTATIRPASLEEKVRIAAKAGYDAIEPWDGELQEYEEKGGNLADLGKKIKDLGLFVPSVIGLWNALPPTQQLWDASLKDTRRRMKMAAAIGAQHIQTIPDTVGTNYDPAWVAARYRDIIEIGVNEFNIQPALVFVKFFPLKTMGQAAAIAMDANHPKAKIIPDVYHMYISGAGFDGIKLLRGDMIAIFQFNDAPSSPAFSELKDEHRVYPGDGILPLPSILKDLKATGFKGCVSLEMYNPQYWKENPMQVAETGLKKTLAVIRKAGV
jgi:2-keto-myo-inositol isomerase